MCRTSLYIIRIMNHDEYYIKYLQSMFGNTSVPFFGILITIITLILMCIIVLLNSTTVFVTPTIINEKPGIKLPTSKNVIL